MCLNLFSRTFQFHCNVRLLCLMVNDVSFKGASAISKFTCQGQIQPVKYVVVQQISCIVRVNSLCFRRCQPLCLSASKCLEMKHLLFIGLTLIYSASLPLLNRDTHVNPPPCHYCPISEISSVLQQQPQASVLWGRCLSE